MSGFFYNLGRSIGAPLRKANWLAQSLAGSEEEALKAEYAVGRDLAAAMLQETPADPDPAVAPWLTELGTALADRLCDKRRHFSFRGVLAEEPNAFALPGGFVFVTRGLLALCRCDRDEVAFVLGHEIGHVVKRHSLERIMANSLVSAVVGRLPVPGGLLRLPLSQVVATLLSQGYSRDDELEADRIGVQLAHSAGFDPAGAVRLLTRLGTFAASTPGMLRYFSSHPPVDVRIRQMNEYLRSAR